MFDAIALFSSSRRKGNTGQLIDRVAAELGIEIVDLASMRMSAYDYEHRNRDDDFEPLMKRVLGFDQIVLGLSNLVWNSVARSARPTSAQYGIATRNCRLPTTVGCGLPWDFSYGFPGGQGAEPPHPL